MTGPGPRRAWIWVWECNYQANQHTKCMDSSLKDALDNNAKQAPQCPNHGPRNRLSEWKAMGADPVLLEALRKGVNSPLYGKPCTQPRREVRHLHEIQTTTGEYLQTGVLRKLTAAESQRTKTWTPVFGRPKKFSDKVRLITDLRELNKQTKSPSTGQPHGAKCCTQSTRHTYNGD